MRATYEDLLAIAMRRAVEAYNLACFDSSDLVAGWRATLSATRHHLRWLGVELSVEDFACGPGEAEEGPLFLLARAIGVGADLLAMQNGTTWSVLDDDQAVRAARSEVAAIAGMGARATITRLVSGQTKSGAGRGLLYGHLVSVLVELESLHESGVSEIGSLGGLATRLPREPVDKWSHISRLAATWQVAHEATSPRTLLTRDLRSTTAQLRTVAGYLTHLAGLLGTPERGQLGEFRSLAESLRAAAAAEARLGLAWRSRLSDVSGRSDSAAEAAFVRLLEALQRWLSEGDRLKRRDEVVPDAESAGRVCGVVDELAHSGHRVASHHEESVWFVIHAGWLFVPKFELAKRDPEFDARPSVWRLRYPQPAWVRTTRASCFEQLTSSLAEATSHFAEAAAIGRRVAGTTEQHRPFGAHFATKPRVLPPPRWSYLASDEPVPAIDDDLPGIDL
ncbi:hypothetical protein OHA18_41320 [Kribbella sp. NBC_00709]|uniref:hypothetical protein n=1 Tax=Kribbella sp. NBC_00709 TaxID=2975972 RepID=UPI002E29D874|nr:hypothetical protein [Kribbella sp. NBC_00709]